MIDVVGGGSVRFSAAGGEQPFDHGASGRLHSRLSCQSLLQSSSYCCGRSVPASRRIRGVSSSFAGPVRRRRLRVQAARDDTQADARKRARGRKRPGAAPAVLGVRKQGVRRSATVGARPVCDEPPHRATGGRVLRHTPTHGSVVGRSGVALQTGPNSSGVTRNLVDPCTNI